MSHPTRVRGLKFSLEALYDNPESVAPHAGAWIEIFPPRSEEMYAAVAPHAGAWIEIDFGSAEAYVIRRRTPRGCVD